jgi:hypothetical protein
MNPLEYMRAIASKCDPVRSLAGTKTTAQRDADKLNAELMGKTLEEFREWREWYTSGRAESFRCLGTTVQGKRCRRHVMTCAHHHSFDAWKALKDGGGYCPTHGG